MMRRLPRGLVPALRESRRTRQAYFPAGRASPPGPAANACATSRALNRSTFAAYIGELGRTHAKPTMKQHLAAIRMLFDWLVSGQMIPVNPAHTVRGPRTEPRKA